MTYFFFTGEYVITYNDIISIQYPLKTDFSTFVKAQQFFDVISKVKAEHIDFKLVSGKLEMKAGKVRSSFATIEDVEFISTMDSVIASAEAVTFKKVTDDFLEALKLCSFVASSNESAQTLTCVHVNKNVVSSTDNARIATSTIKSNKYPEMLIKASEISSLIDIDPTAYALSKSWIHFRGDSGSLFSIRRIKGEFPDMSQFLSFEGTEVNLPKEILDGLDIASVFIDDDNPSVSISLRKGACRIYKDSEGGLVDYREKVKYNGDSINFNINPAFLKEMLTHSTTLIVSDDKVRLESGSFIMVTALYGV